MVKWCDKTRVQLKAQGQSRQGDLTEFCIIDTLAGLGRAKLRGGREAERTGRRIDQTCGLAPKVAEEAGLSKTATKAATRVLVTRDWHHDNDGHGKAIKVQEHRRRQADQNHQMERRRQKPLPRRCPESCPGTWLHSFLLAFTLANMSKEAPWPAMRDWHESSI